VHLGGGSVQITPFTMHTSDSRAGAELVDVVLSSLLGQGFALLTSFDGPGLAALPPLADRSAQLDHGGPLLQLLEPGGSLYDGDLGAAVSDRWHKAVRGRGQLVVLVGSAIDLGLEDRTERTEAARRAGGVAGAQVPVHEVDLRGRSYPTTVIAASWPGHGPSATVQRPVTYVPWAG
jgi:hypothetical protein